MDLENVNQRGKNVVTNTLHLVELILFIYRKFELKNEFNIA